MTRTRQIGLLIALVGLFLPVGAQAQEEPAAPPSTLPSPGVSATSPPAARVLVAFPQSALVVELDLRIDGVPVIEKRQEALRRVFQRVDLDGDGRLSEAEFSKSPTHFGIRQLPTGRVTATQSTRQLPDKQKDIGLNEFLSHQMHDHPTGVYFTVGRSQFNEPLSRSLDQALAAAAQALAPNQAAQPFAKELLALVDGNQDQLISPGELLPGIRYPGTNASRLVTRSGTQVGDSTEPALVAILDAGAEPLWLDSLMQLWDQDQDGFVTGSEWSLASFALGSLDRDRDQQLDRTEILAFVRSLPVVRGQIDFGTDAALTSLRNEDQAKLPVNVRLHAQRVPPTKALQRIDDLSRQFEELRASDSAIQFEQTQGLANEAEFQQFFLLADRDSNQRLEATEVRSWVETWQGLLATHCVVSLVDFQTNTFFRHDTNDDGLLSIPELMSAHATDHRPDIRQIAIVVTQGQPVSLLAGTADQGPEWFQSMDRNRDLRLDPQEFLGTPDQFRALDLDDNRFIEVSEAQKVRD